jgi:hypothetical protein
MNFKLNRAAALAEWHQIIRRIDIGFAGNPYCLGLQIFYLIVTLRADFIKASGDMHRTKRLDT